MPCRATEYASVMVESAEQNVVQWRREWQATSVFLPREPHEQYEKTERTLKDELPRSVGAQYATGDQWRNNFRKNEKKEPKQKNQNQKTPSCGCD